MKKIFFISVLFSFLLSSCSEYFEYDNFDEPDSGIEGAVIDKKTNEPLSTETGNSFKIEYYELSWDESENPNTQSRVFWGKGDGTFKNTKIFAGEYRITLKEGAFHSPEPSVVTLQKNKLTTLNYVVVPFLRVKIDNLQLSGDKQNNLVITYTVEDTENEINTEGMNEDLFTLSEAQVFISRKSPNVGVANTETQFTLRAKKDISNYDPGVPKTYVESNVKNLPAGKYWIRIGARTDNPQKRYNFTPVQEFTVPEL
jgi:hypothetical protein